MRNATRLGGIPLVCIALAALGGCGGRADESVSTIRLAGGGPAVETVNGEAVPQKLLDALARKNNWDLSKPEIRERALRDLTGYVVAAQAAREQKLADDPDFAAAAELARLQGLASATVAEFQKRANIDDSVLRAEYDKQVAKAGGAEYDFANLVFEKEADALKVAGEAIGGKPFEQVMEAHKKDARQSRAFTRVRASQLPEPLAKALEGMKAGETAKTPVQTRFGWHVVHLNAVKPYEPPPFEQVKDSLKRSLVKRAGEERLTKLREEAKVTVNDSALPPATPKPATPQAPAPAPAQPPPKPQG